MRFPGFDLLALPRFLDRSGQAYGDDGVVMSEREKPLKGCRILLLEDDVFIGMDLDDMLKEAGATVVGPIGTLDEAMKAVEAHGFGLALLDVKVRGGFSYGIADELKRQGIPFVFATGYDAQAIPPRFADVKQWQKPIRNDQGLVRELAMLCRHA